MSSPHDATPADALKRLSAELSKLGAETSAERAAKRWLPWVVSIAIHLGVVFIAVFITWTVSNRPVPEESIIVVADFNAMLYDPVAVAGEPEEFDPVRSQIPALPSQSLTNPSADQLLGQSRESDDRALSLISEIGSGARSDGGSALAGFAPAGDPTAASFAGTSATNARRIVYLIDATGSMVAHLPIVIDELARSLSNLSPQQSFTVIFFQGNESIEVPPGGRLIPASPSEHQRIVDWIRKEVVAQDRTNPIPAIEMAIKRKPDVIFLLSHGLTGHGEFEIDQRDLLSLLDTLNPINRTTGRRTTQINCIQFIAEDPLDTMKQIAQQHGGPNGYKFLSRRELGLGQH